MKVLKVKPSSTQQIEMLEKEVHIAELHILAFGALFDKLSLAKEGDEVLNIATKEEVLKLIDDYEKQYVQKNNKLDKLFTKKFEKDFLTHMEVIHDCFFGEQAPEKQVLEKQASEIPSNPDAENPDMENPDMENPDVENQHLNKILNNKILNNKVLNNKTTTLENSLNDPAISQTGESPNKKIQLKNKTLINKTKA